jgi:ectoine hydroxylase-related dioxygenase (phytanoyl-CoA dioxygenase family)
VKRLMMPDQYVSSIEEDGFAISRRVLSSRTIEELRAALRGLDGDRGAYGRRNLLGRCPAVKAVTQAPEIRRLVDPILGDSAFPVRALLFDKLPGANWGVAWHQDLTIAVKQRADVEGFSAWTVKGGVPHVQPPVAILEGMLTLRLHLDEADEDNGALMVLPRTHALGRLPEDWQPPSDQNASPVVCAADAGDVLSFRPLLLHMSRKSRRLTHRRVVQIEFAPTPLPPALQWYEQPTP